MDSENQYGKRIVAYIDILGFSNYIEESDRDNEKYVKVKELITNINSKIETDFYDTFREQCKTENEIISVSDSIIISHSMNDDSEPDKGALFNIIQDVLEYQVFLLENGWLCRGAISFGKLHHQKNVIFGKSYIDAYKLESKVAKYPRIIFSTELINFYKDKLFKDWLILDKDGHYFLDYLERCRIHPNSDKILTNLKNTINNILENETKYELIEKYIWLKDYYNFSISDESLKIYLDMSSLRFNKSKGNYIEDSSL